MDKERISPFQFFETMQISGFDPITNCHFYETSTEQYFMGPECGRNVKIEKDESGEFVAVLIE